MNIGVMHNKTSICIKSLIMYQVFFYPFIVNYAKSILRNMQICIIVTSEANLYITRNNQLQK